MLRSENPEQNRKIIKVKITAWISRKQSNRCQKVRILCSALHLHVLYFMFCNSASSSTVRKIFSSEFMQKSKIEDKGMYKSKIEGGGHHGGNSGKPHGNGGNGNNGSSRSLYKQGGAAVIPVYTAGAANNNRHRQGHHSSGSQNTDNIRFPTLLIILVSPLRQLSL